MDHCDVLIIGTGAVGSAAMYYLAERGVNVVGLDRFPVAHDKGSSHGQTRIIRLAYFEHPNYVPLLRRSYELWKDLEEKSGNQLYSETGIIQIGPTDGEIVTGVKASAQEHGLEIENLTASDVTSRYPGFMVPEGMEAVFEKRAGFLKVEQSIKAYIKLALNYGAELHTDVSVDNWKRSSSNGIEVTTSRGVFSADNLIITAGAWAKDLLRPLNLNLTVARKPLFWFESDRTYDIGAGCPAFFYETPQGSFYGFPSIDELGLKVAEHTSGDPVLDPLKVDRTLHKTDKAKIDGFIGSHLSKMHDPRMTDHKICMYTRSEDEHFIVDSIPGSPHVNFVAGLSGHGFKMASVLGEIMADLAINKSTNHPIDFLSAKRFIQ